MLKKNIDLLAIGKSYPAILLSLEFLEQGKDVLLLDDDRLQLGELHTDRPLALEKEYLRSWGEQRSIEPLINIERYLKNIPTTFVFNDTRLRLGESPARNCQELFRKIPLPIGPWILGPDTEEIEHFNNSYLNYCRLLGETIYQHKNSHNFSLDAFTALCPPLLKPLYDSFQKALAIDANEQNESYWKLKTLFYMAQGIFQKTLSLHTRPMEFYHLFLCLLSPYYQLDREKLLKDLIALNNERGGQFKETSIREWLFHKRKPWSVELVSYEGIIHPKKMAFIGAVPKGNLVGLKSHTDHYTSLRIFLFYSNGDAKELEGERILFSHIERLGTEFPIWEGTFGQKQAVITAFIFARKGCKVDFLRKGIQTKLFQDLEYLIDGFTANIKDTHIEFSEEMWIDKTKSPPPPRGSFPLTKTIELLDTTKPHGHAPLKNVYYFGPCSEGSLGLLSTLMDINERRQLL